MKRRLIDAHKNSIAHVRNAIDIVQTVIRQNLDLIDAPLDENDEMRWQRVLEGEAELRTLREELAVLETRDPLAPPKFRRR